MKADLASKQPLLLLGFHGLGSLVFKSQVWKSIFLSQQFISHSALRKSIFEMHFKCIFQHRVHMAMLGQNELIIFISWCHSLYILREELVAEYLKQNPEQDLAGEPDDQGGQLQVPGQGGNTKYAKYPKYQFCHHKYQIHSQKKRIHYKNSKYQTHHAK